MKHVILCMLLPRRSSAVCMLMLLGAWLAPTNAYACSCDTYPPRLVFPPPSNSYVDPVFLIETGTNGTKFVAVEAGDGTRVPLVKVRDVGHYGCENPEQLVRPMTNLAANTDYTFVLESEGETSLSGDVFRTGTSTWRDFPQDVPSISFARLRNADCESDDCAFHAQLRVDVPADRWPQYLHIRAPTLPRGGDRIMRITRNDTAARFTIGMMDLPAGSCIEYSWYDLRGTELTRGSLCEPEECVTLVGNYWRDDTGECDDSLSDITFPPSLWRFAGAGSCANPPHVMYEGEDSSLVDRPSPGDGDAEADEGEGCTLSSSPSNSVFLWLLAGALLWRRAKGPARRRTHTNFLVLGALGCSCSSSAGFAEPRIAGVTYELGGGLCPQGEECSDRIMGFEEPNIMILGDADGDERVTLAPAEFDALSNTVNGRSYRAAIASVQMEGCPLAFDTVVNIELRYDDGTPPCQ